MVRSNEGTIQEPITSILCTDITRIKYLAHEINSKPRESSVCFNGFHRNLFIYTKQTLAKPVFFVRPVSGTYI